MNETEFMNGVPRHLAFAAGAALILISKKSVNLCRNRIADEIAFWILFLTAVAMTVDIVWSVIALLK